MTWGSAHRAPSAARARRRPRDASPPAACGTTGSTRRRCARPTRAGAADRPQPPFGRRWGASPRPRRRRPGTAPLRPNTKAPLALTLKLNGYSTAPVRQVPRGAGVAVRPDGAVRHVADGRRRVSSTSTDSSAGRTTSRYPALYEGLTPVEPPKTPEEGYHLPRTWPITPSPGCATQKALMPDKPFFMYFAPGATHAPHHVPGEWADKYKGKFDAWLGRAAREHLRPAEGARRHPADADLTARHDEIPAWDDMPDAAQAGPGARDGSLRGLPGAHRSSRRPGHRRAGAAGCPGGHPGLLHHRRQRRLGRGHAAGRVQRDGELQRRGSASKPPSSWCPGSTSSALPTSYNHYAVGWAWAMDTPYQWTKQVASHWGGTRNGTIVHWPRGITGHGRDPDAVLPCH